MKLNSLYLTSHHLNWRSDLTEGIPLQSQTSCPPHLFLPYKDNANSQTFIESDGLIITQLVPLLARMSCFSVFAFRSTSIDPAVPIDKPGFERASAVIVVTGTVLSSSSLSKLHKSMGLVPAVAVAAAAAPSSVTGGTCCFSLFFSSCTHFRHASWNDPHLLRNKFVFNVAGETFNFVQAKDTVCILLTLTATVIRPKIIIRWCVAKRAGGTLVYWIHFNYSSVECT